MNGFAPSKGYAGFWKRLAALFIDLCVTVLAATIMDLSLGPENRFVDSLSASPLTRWLMGLLYCSFMESSTWRGTIGKMAVGIAVVDSAGNRITLERAMGRYVGRIASSLPIGAGFPMAAFTPRKQALHDLIAKTLVVNK